MNKEKVIQSVRNSGAICFDKDGAYGNYQAGGALFTPDELQRFAQAIRNEALDEASERCEVCTTYTKESRYGVNLCVDAIRNLKETQ